MRAFLWFYLFELSHTFDNIIEDKTESIILIGFHRKRDPPIICLDLIISLITIELSDSFGQYTLIFTKIASFYSFEYNLDFIGWVFPFLHMIWYDSNWYKY